MGRLDLQVIEQCGRVVGYVLQWLRTPAGWLLLQVLPASIMTAWWLLLIWSREPQPERSDERGEEREATGGERSVESTRDYAPA